MQRTRTFFQRTHRRIIDFLVAECHSMSIAEYIIAETELNTILPIVNGLKFPIRQNTLYTQYTYPTMDGDFQ